MRHLFLLLLLTVCIVNSKAQTLVPYAIDSECDEQEYLVIDIEESNGATGLQFYLTLPEGVTFDSNNVDYGVQLSVLNGMPNHNYSVELCSTGQLQIVLYSLDQIEFSDGVLMRIPLNVGSTPIDTYGRLMNVRTSTVDAISHLCDDVLFHIKASPTITFADANVKAICVQNWDTNGNGELSEAEAAAVTSLGTVFKGNTEITSFDELRYFTGLTEICDSAFYNCTALTSVTIPENVTSIVKWAFRDCTGLTKAEFASLEHLCNMEFEYGVSNPLSYAHHLYINGEEVTEVVIPNSVTSIKKNTFEGCSSLTSVTFHDGITSFGEFAFSGCSSLSEIALPNGLNEISDNLFTGCSSLTNVIIPEGVESIGFQAFSGCTSLNHIVIPQTVTSLEDGAFENCGTLSLTIYVETPPTISSFVFMNTERDTLYVPIGCKAAYEAANIWKKFKVINEMATPSPTITFTDANVKDICVQNWDTNGDGELSEAEAAAVTDLGEVFKGNSSITTFNELQYFTGLTNICDYAFYDCSSLTSIDIPNSVTGIREGAFASCSSLSSVTIPNSVTFIDYYTFTGCSALTSIDIPNSVTYIGEYAFYGCSNLTSIDIPNSVTFIHNYVFQGCSSLTSVNIPSSVTYICDYAFKDCSSLTSIDIPNSVTSIGEFAFQGCSSLKSVTIPNSITSISRFTFNGCSDLTSVDIPNSVTVIGRDAFSGCSGLTSVTIPNSVTSIGNWAFSSCSNLTSVTIPNSVTSIEVGVFECCSGLTNITIPNSVTSIGEEAFYKCSSLTNITIPNSVTSINGSAFAYCSSLTSIYVDSGNSKYDSRNGCNAIIETASNTLIAGCNNTTIPNSVTSIGSYAFDGCSGLTSVTIPNSVTSIGDYAFYSCSGLTNITIPNSVTSIGDYAFYELDLAFVKMDSDNPPTISRYTFSYRKGKLYVPIGSKAAYEATDYVYRFNEIIEFIDGDVNGDGESDVVDVVDIARYVVGTPAETFVEILADINNNGEVNIADAVCLVNEIAGDQNFAKPMGAPSKPETTSDAPFVSHATPPLVRPTNVALVSVPSSLMSMVPPLTVMLSATPPLARMILPLFTMV